MRRKLKDTGGLTLVETLCAAAILLLLGIMLNTGIQMAVRSNRDITAQAELQLLLSTLSDALADDLRYARDPKTEVDGKLSYISDSYNTGGRAILTVNADGQVEAGGKRVLPRGAYGNGAYQVETMDITYAEAEGLFTIELKVKQTDGAISAETDFTVRCLKP